MGFPLPEQIDDLPNWIVRSATAHDSGEELLDGICICLLRNGMPLWRVGVSAPTIDPQIRAGILHWRRDSTMDLETALHGEEADERLRISPISVLLSENRFFGRWTLADGDGCDVHPELELLRREGGTDCAIFMVGFSQSTSITGTAISITTDHPNGFSEGDFKTIGEIVPALGLAVYRQVLLFAATQALNSYLGPMTGTKVLAGQIVRGQGEIISAAIFLADLSGFTSLTDREDPIDVVRWLNEHLEAIGEPVTENGGEILKFLGDGLMAVFPVVEKDCQPCLACESALRAAREAISRNAKINERRAAAGMPELAVDIALHFGEVVYGNVGTSRRLDFTTIGRAVNEASRIEKLCGELGHHLLVSEDFSRRCQQPFKRLGAFELRGVGLPREILTPE